jgi:hypothetical protein
LSHLDRLLRRVLVNGVPELSTANLVSEAQVSFVAPGSAWSGETPPGPRLSVYLVDVRENLKLRSNERIETRTGTGVKARRAPYRMDCHYLISAFSPPTRELVAAPPEQHALLYAATSALVRSQPLIPAHVYPPGEPLLKDWADSSDVELPMIVNPQEGFPKLAEFWGTLGAPQPWQPVVYVIVTLPVERLDGDPVEMVRRRTTTYRVGVAAENLVEIGGVVLNRAGEPVGRAWVSAGILPGGNRDELARTTTDDDGKFILQLPAAATHLWAAAFGVGVTSPLDISLGGVNASDDFTLRFT